MFTVVITHWSNRAYWGSMLSNGFKSFTKSTISYTKAIVAQKVTMVQGLTEPLALWIR